MSPRAVRVSMTLYRALLRVYPAEHRREYGEAMAQTFRDMASAAYERRGAPGLFELWIETAVDTGLSAAAEHRAGGIMSRRSLIVLGMTLVFSAVTGYINATATEVLPPMTCLLLFSFLAGLMQPKGAWRWGLLIGSSIMISTFVGLAIRFKFADPPTHNPITLLVLVIPALAAAYGGSLASHMASAGQSEQPRRA